MLSYSPLSGSWKYRPDMTHNPHRTSSGGLRERVANRRHNDRQTWANRYDNAPAVQQLLLSHTRKEWGLDTIQKWENVLSSTNQLLYFCQQLVETKTAKNKAFWSNFHIGPQSPQGIMGIKWILFSSVQLKIGEITIFLKRQRQKTFPFPFWHNLEYSKKKKKLTQYRVWVCVCVPL